MSAIRTIVRWSERNGGLLSFEKYHKSTKKIQVFTANHHRSDFNEGKSRVEKQEERQVSKAISNKKNVSLWQKAKNLFNRIRGK